MPNPVKEPCDLGKCSSLKIITITLGLITIFWIVCGTQRIESLPWKFSVEQPSRMTRLGKHIYGSEVLQNFPQPNKILLDDAADGNSSTLISSVHTSTFGPLNTLKPPPMEGIRKHIYESKWIQLFPNIKKMVEVVTDGNESTITDPTHTSINVLNMDNLQVGGQLQADIISYNRERRRKAYGGDFFAVALRRPGSRTDGVTCEITDKMNGSYSVSCILPWEGAAIVEARLIHPSETIFQLMKRYSSEKEFQIHQKTTMLNSKNQTENTACSVGFPDKRPDELCDYSNPTHGEKRTCIRPPSGECPKIILNQRMLVEGPALRTYRDNLYCTKKNFIVPIFGSGLTISIKPSKKPTEQHYFTGDLSQFSLDPMTPSGWLIDGKWTSRKSHTSYELDSETLKKCLRHKRLYFLGDSTSRNIYRVFIGRLKIKDYGADNSVAWSQGRNGESKDLNVTLQYRAHGPPLNNQGPEDSRPYMSDSFDAIKEGGNGTIVMFTIGYHFHFFDPDVYLRRIRIIKQAVISFLSRFPGSKVIVKGLHYHYNQGFGRSPWLSYVFDILMRYEFRYVKGTVFLENWDYCLLNNSPGLHPPENVLLGTIRMLMVHVCES